VSSTASDYRTPAYSGGSVHDDVDSGAKVSNDAAMKPCWRYIGGVIGAFIVVGMILPARVQVEREILIDAYPATVFALVNDFQQFNRWSGWMDNDPNTRINISEPPSGVGASLSWASQIIGNGRLTITASDPFTSITSILDLGADNVATNVFFLSQTDTHTRVLWHYERDFGLHLAGRYFGLMLDGIIGPQYEADLVNLKQHAETLPRFDFSALEIEQIIVEANEIAYRSTRSIPEAAAISEAMADAYYDILQFVAENDLAEAGAPLSITRSFDGALLEFDAAIPVRGVIDDTRTSGQSVRIGTTFAGPVIRVKHVGSYATLGQTHDKIAAWLAARGVARNGDAWEVYSSDPTSTIESELLTYIYYPVAYQDYSR
jgi:effector-binding domain-containing protein